MANLKYLNKLNYLTKGMTKQYKQSLLNNCDFLHTFRKIVLNLPS